MTSGQWLAVLGLGFQSAGVIVLLARFIQAMRQRGVEWRGLMAMLPAPEKPRSTWSTSVDIVTRVGVGTPQRDHLCVEERLKILEAEASELQQSTMGLEYYRKLLQKSYQELKEEQRSSQESLEGFVRDRISEAEARGMLSNYWWELGAAGSILVGAGLQVAAALNP